MRRGNRKVQLLNLPFRENISLVFIYYNLQKVITKLNIILENCYTNVNIYK